MKVVIDNSALLSRKNGVYRYTECVVNGLIKKLGESSIKLFPALKVIEFARNKAMFDKSTHEQFDWYSLALSGAFCNLKEKIEVVNREVKASNCKCRFLAKINREGLRFFKKIIESLFDEKRILKDGLEKDQLYHCLYGYIPNEIKKIPSLKLCITVHDIIHILYPDLIEGGRHYCDEREISQIKELTNKEIIFTVSECSKNDLCNFNKKIDPKNVHVTYLAPAREFQPINDNQVIGKIREKYNIPISCKYVLSTLSSDPKKNVSFVIKSFLDLILSEKLNDLKLVLMGKKEVLAGLPKEAREKIEKHKEQIILTGFVEDEEMAILHSGALYFCFPSLYEGFGIPILEAMQCGVPVITSNVSSLPEIAGNAAILVDPTNEDELKQSFLNLYKNAPLREALSAQGIERAAQFSWDKCIDKMTKVYALHANN